MKPTFDSLEPKALMSDFFPPGTMLRPPIPEIIIPIYFEPIQLRPFVPPILIYQPPQPDIVISTPYNEPMKIYYLKKGDDINANIPPTP